MSSPPISPRPKRGVRGYIRDKYDKLVRSHSRSPSAEISTSGAYPTSSPSQTYDNTLAPPTVEEAAAIRHAKTAPTITSVNPATVPSVRSGDASSDSLRNALQALHVSAGIFPPLQSAIGALISCLDVLEAASKNHQEYENIATELKTLSQSLMRHIKESKSTRLSDCVINVALAIEQQTALVNAKRGIGRRFLGAEADEEEIIQYYRRIEALFRQLQTDANLSTWSIANEHLVNTRLESLAPAKLASYDSSLSTEINRRTCTDGTRTAILSAMDEWSNDPQAPDLYWMDGMAGTGKTTIACSFSKRLEERKQLAASFFCARSSPECRQVSRIIPTIAYQLARYSIPFQGALCEILGNEPDIGTKNVVKQVERLLKEPLENVKTAMPDNLVVVIDALDECEDRYGVQLVLDLLFTFSPSLPLKFFVTSRPEPVIYNKMVAQTPSSRTVLHLHEIEKSLVKADIELYLREELSFMSPTDKEIGQLVERSGNLFIYAATLVRYVRPTTYFADPRRRLWGVLETASQFTDQYAEVDALYTIVLESALGEKRMNMEEAEDMRLVLRTVLCVQEPVNVKTLATLAGIDTPLRVLSALQPLRSVVYFSEINGTVSTLHASFPDFMFNQTRSGSFFCDRTEHNQVLARRCFEVMKAQLRFNICGLETSFIPDAKVVDLESRIEGAISPALWYTCIYWGDHLQEDNSAELHTMLDDFLSSRLLFWVEVLNLKRSIVLGTGVLMKARLWLQAGVASPNLIRYSDDAHSFLTSYAANPVSQSTPHIYISSLPLLPRSSSVFKHYLGCIRGLISLKGSGMERRETAALATWSFNSPVRIIRYSPDGGRVASGCNDGSINICNAYDGSAVVEPFIGHTNSVTALSFSPDGSQLVSGSDDGIIRLWNANDGVPIPCSFHGHTNEINSIKFLPDASRIISCSTDRTVRIWRAADGATVGDPFRGHTKAVLGIAISPDGTRVASSSVDCTIQVWNVDNGMLSFNPLRGHTEKVWSVDFSSDGRLIVSGSDDHTVMLWDADTGAPISSPLQGHTAGVNSVAFSPDGKRLVSGSDDSTIRIWSTENPTLIAGPLEGHTDIVLSVAFSPDSMRVISASYDRTIRVWNTREGVPVVPQSEGHTMGVWSVAYSPNGSRIVSGSYDQTIRLWDTNSGSPVATPFKGHTAKIWSVSFSPDGTRIASGSADHTVRVWGSQNGTPVTNPITGHTKGVNSVAFSPDGTHLASGSSDATIRIWSLPAGKLIVGPLEGHTSLIQSVAFSPNGKNIASGSYDHTIRVWDSSKGTLAANPFCGHTSWVMSVAFSPDGSYIASGSKDRTIRIWKAVDGASVTGPCIGHSDTINSVAFSPDGTYIASASHDCSVRLWSSLDGTLILGPLCGHSRWVTSVAFSPDSTHLVSGSIDHSIRIWDIRKSQQTASDSDSPIHSLPLPTTNHPRFTVSGDWAVRNDGWIVSEDGCLLFWVPQDLRRSLLTPHCTHIISRGGKVEIDMSQALLGHQWAGCYVS